MDISKYVGYFLLGGVVTVIGEMIIEKYESGVALSSYLYGAVPTIYMMLLWFAYIKSGKKGYDTFIVHSLVNCGMFYIVMLILFALSFNRLRLKKSFSLTTDLGIAFSVFLVMSTIYFKYFFKRKFSF